jgi:hypothetical protein
MPEEGVHSGTAVGRSDPQLDCGRDLYGTPSRTCSPAALSACQTQTSHMGLEILSRPFWTWAPLKVGLALLFMWARVPWSASIFGSFVLDLPRDGVP